MTLQIFATSAEGHDGTEIRLFVGELERLGSLPGARITPEDILGKSICIGTIHAGDYWKLNEWADEDNPDAANGAQCAYVTEKVRVMLDAHGLEPAVVGLQEMYRALDRLAASFLEAGPPWYYTTVAVRTKPGCAEPRLNW